MKINELIDAILETISNIGTEDDVRSAQAGIISAGVLYALVKANQSTTPPSK